MSSCVRGCRRSGRRRSLESMIRTWIRRRRNCVRLLRMNGARTSSWTGKTRQPLFPFPRSSIPFSCTTFSTGIQCFLCYCKWVCTGVTVCVCRCVSVCRLMAVVSYLKLRVGWWEATANQPALPCWLLFFKRLIDMKQRQRTIERTYYIHEPVPTRAIFRWIRFYVKRSLPF